MVVYCKEQFLSVGVGDTYCLVDTRTNCHAFCFLPLRMYVCNTMEYAICRMYVRDGGIHMCHLLCSHTFI